MRILNFSPSAIFFITLALTSASPLWAQILKSQSEAEVPSPQMTFSLAPGIDEDELKKPGAATFLDLEASLKTPLEELMKKPVPPIEALAKEEERIKKFAQENAQRARTEDGNDGIADSGTLSPEDRVTDVEDALKLKRKEMAKIYGTDLKRLTDSVARYSKDPSSYEKEVGAEEARKMKEFLQKVDEFRSQPKAP